MKLPQPLAAKAAALFGLSATEAAMLSEAPYRAMAAAMPPTDATHGLPHPCPDCPRRSAARSTFSEQLGSDRAAAPESQIL